jgi:hypothetical protein
VQLENGNAREAREQLGRGFHAIQDFFAHSNFIDNHPDPKDALDPVRTPLDMLNLKNPAPEAACVAPHFQGPLTTGYFPDDWKPFPHKCTHAEMNKDYDVLDSAGRALNPLARARAVIECARYLDALMALLQTEVAAGRLQYADLLKFKGL